MAEITDPVGVETMVVTYTIQYFPDQDEFGNILTPDTPNPYGSALQKEEGNLHYIIDTVAAINNSFEMGCKVLSGTAESTQSGSHNLLPE